MPEIGKNDVADNVRGKPEATALKTGNLTTAQKRWLKKGVEQPGWKLPLFDDNGRAIPARTIQSCIDAGWAEPWFSNPIKPDWLVCKLTPAAVDALSASPKGKKS